MASHQNSYFHLFLSVEIVNIMKIGVVVGKSERYSLCFNQKIQKPADNNLKKSKKNHRNLKVHLSYMITVSAVARFIPNPPALVERRKQNLEEFLALNRSIRTCLSAPPTLPSILSYCQF